MFTKPRQVCQRPVTQHQEVLLPRVKFPQARDVPQAGWPHSWGIQETSRHGPLHHGPRMSGCSSLGRQAGPWAWTFPLLVWALGLMLTQMSFGGFFEDQMNSFLLSSAKLCQVHCRFQLQVPGTVESGDDVIMIGIDMVQVQCHDILRMLLNFSVLDL